MGLSSSSRYGYITLALDLGRKRYIQGTTLGEEAGRFGLSTS